MAPLAAGAPADRKDIVLRGRVSDEKGRPLSDAHWREATESVKQIILRGIGAL